ncbi:putative lipoprotein [Synechococcus sp. A18-25c]|nr:putative lipoprotein [Synechococcus sp. A18-25c]
MKKPNNYRRLSFVVVFFLMDCAAELIPPAIPYLSFAIIPLSILSNKATVIALLDHHDNCPV